MIEDAWLSIPDDNREQFRIRQGHSAIEQQLCCWLVILTPHLHGYGVSVFFHVFRAITEELFQQIKLHGQSVHPGTLCCNALFE